MVCYASLIWDAWLFVPLAAALVQNHNIFHHIALERRLTNVLLHFPYDDAQLYGSCPSSTSSRH